MMLDAFYDRVGPDRLCPTSGLTSTGLTSRLIAEREAQVDGGPSRAFTKP
jgi:hypothetical protein